MTQLPISPGPGICLSASDYASGKDAANVGSGGSSSRQGQGRYVSGYNIEFIAGFAQKVAGYTQASASLTTDVPRSCCVWRDNTGGARVGIGTETHLYYLLGATLTDITPLRSISAGTLTDPITTTINSRLVAIADSSQKVANGDWVFLSAAAAVGGVMLDNWYQVSSRSGSGYNVTVPTAASSSAGPGGGAVAFQYPRVTLTNPFTTVAGSAVVTVHHVAHGAATGNYVTFSGASAVAGLTLNGEYILTRTGADDYTITASSTANASTSGGGTVSAVYDIQVQQVTNTTGVGYGQGAYGVGAYGVGPISVTVLANGWTLDAYGSQLLAAPIGGTIYIYDPAFGGRAYPMLNAPASLNAMFVTPERFVVALGINGNLMEMAWCDQNDYTVWTTLPTNTANSGRSLIGGSYFVGGIGIRDGVSLIFSDRCVFQMNYTGNVEVYNTPQIGDNCGLVDPTAVCTEGGVAYWMSDQDFWSWNGGVALLPTDDVRAYIFQGGLNRQYLNKCTAILNRAKRQVRFYYPFGSSIENNAGMIYQYDQQCFSPLAYGRTAGADAELLAAPVSTDATGRIYYDETGTDANGAALPTYIEVSDIDISNGDRNADIFGWTPDFQTLSGTIDLTILTKYYPSDTATIDGPYAITSDTQRQDLRADGKLFAFALASNALGATFRLGVPRLDVQPSGARR